MSERVCLSCGEAKPLSEYYRHAPSKGGRRAVCKTCLRARRPATDASREKDRAYRDTVQGRYVVWGKNLRASYGIDQEDWARMFNAQQMRCAICCDRLDVNADDRQIHVDHDHVTGKVRQILCKHCNSLIGMCGEDVQVLEAAIEYLRRHHA